MADASTHTHHETEQRLKTLEQQVQKLQQEVRDLQIKMQTHDHPHTH